MFHKNDFLDHMYVEFPGPLANNFSREMLENVVALGEELCLDDDGMRKYLCRMVPQVYDFEVSKFLDGNPWDDARTDGQDEVLHGLVEEKVRQAVALVQNVHAPRRTRRDD